MLLCALLLFAALAAPFFQGHVYTADDLAAFHLPLRAFYAACLVQQQPFDWLPGLFNGYYAHAEGQGGFYHPWHLLLYRALPLRAAFGWEILANYPVLCLGMYALLRRHGLPRSAAWFGGLLAAASGFSLLHFMHTNALAVLAHLPWLLWVSEIRLTTRAPRVVARCELAIALLTASQLLLGYPQYVWISLVAEGAYLTWRVITLGSGGTALAWIAGAKLFALGLAALQLIPTFEALGGSTREGVGRDFAGWGSLHPANLVQLVAPYALAKRVVGGNTHELGLYLGAVPVALVVWLLVARSSLSHESRRLAGAAGLLAIFALLMALGEYSGFYRWQTWLPVVGKFRFPCRFISLFHLALAVLTAIAFANLTAAAARADGIQLRVRRALQGLVVVACFTALLIVCLVPSESQAWWPWILAGPMLTFLAAIGVELASRQVRGAQIFLIVLATCDLGIYGLTYAVWPHHESLATLAASTEQPPAPGQRVALDLAPFDRPAQHRGNQLLLAGWQRVDGYAGLQPARQLDYTQVAALRIAGVAWVGPLAGERLADARPFAAGWTPIEKALPHARLITHAQVSHDPAADLASIDPAITALVDRALELDEAAPGHVELLDQRPGAVHFLTRTSGRQLLVVADSYHPDWQVQVDGQPAELVRIYGDFLGCVVPPGIHQVDFRFRPRSLRTGAIVSAISLVGCLMLFLGRAWRGPAIGQAKPIVGGVSNQS